MQQSWRLAKPLKLSNHCVGVTKAQLAGVQQAVQAIEQEKACCFPGIFYTSCICTVRAAGCHLPGKISAGAGAEG